MECERRHRAATATNSACFALFTVMALSSQPVRACDCDNVDLNERATLSDLVFQGVLSEIESTDAATCQGEGNYVLRSWWNVSTVWKGAVAEEQMVPFFLNEGCGVAPTVGSELVVFAVPYQATLSAAECFFASPADALAAGFGDGAQPSAGVSPAEIPCEAPYFPIEHDDDSSADEHDSTQPPATCAQPGASAPGVALIAFIGRRFGRRRALRARKPSASSLALGCQH